jgi:hypothetical protein
MGDFAGNAGLFSLWFDEETWDWRFEFVNCGLGRQHFWWVVHIVDLITIGVTITYGISTLVHRLGLLQHQPSVPTRSGNGKAVTSLSKSNIQEKVKEEEPMKYLSTNGNLDAPGAGRKSLRKKKSRRNLNGSATASTI